ncbi:MAG: cytochrome c-type biogenesis protein CcmH [Alphaproteobacteria bacterium]|nr:MAG: cytochrome c-type biogenesis protein CcmH [Alphaproteobacteria bacterium]
MIRLRRNTTTVVPARVPATKDPHPPTPSAWVPPSPAVRERGFTPRQRTRLALAALILATITGTAPAHAVRPDEMLADPALEARAREISRELRCLVCRNQSIDDSDADLAHDLRVLVRERLKGDFVLLRPPFAIGTALLWGGPLLVLLLGAFAVARLYRRRDVPVPPLSAEERQRLSAVLEEEAPR